MKVNDHIFNVTSLIICDPILDPKVFLEYFLTLLFPGFKVVISLTQEAAWANGTFSSFDLQSDVYLKYRYSDLCKFYISNIVTLCDADFCIIFLCCDALKKSISCFLLFHVFI